jgi:hypothetical protein
MHAHGTLLLEYVGTFWLVGVALIWLVFSLPWHWLKKPDRES